MNSVDTLLPELHRKLDQIFQLGKLNQKIGIKELILAEYDRLDDVPKVQLVPVKKGLVIK